MRGTAAGEGVVSQAQTKAFDEGHERIFGKDRKPQRGRWIWDEQLQKLVSAEDYQPPVRALDAPIMCDRFMEGSVATDGTDIGSRRKREEYKRREGVTDASDYKPGHGEKVHAANERAVAETTRRTAAEVARMDPRHLPKYLQEKK